MAEDTRREKRAKPDKPRANYPLFPHASGQWAKKVQNETHYFGVWADPVAAELEWLRQEPYLRSGKTPPPKDAPPALTVMELANKFLSAKKHLVETGELSTRTFADYYTTAERLIDVFGKNHAVEALTADDFLRLRENVAKTRGPVGLGNFINRARVIFNFAFADGLIEKPVRFGVQFKRPSKMILRKERHARGPKLFEPDEVRKMIDAAAVQLRAMILLAINAGMGNTDVAQIPLSAINLQTGWCDFPRPKTAIVRRCPLWSETVRALREAIAARPAPKLPDAVPLVFVTKYGRPWVRHIIHADEEEGTLTQSSNDAVALQFVKLLNKLGMKKDGRSFYSLRHTFATVAGESRDQVAVNALMGHVDPSMAASYREAISDDRLLVVTEFVRKWLPPSRKPKTKSSAKR